MGRQKGDPNRSKNRPSSSSAAASLLQSSRAIGVGFGGYVGSSRVDAPDFQENEQQWDVDGEAALHLRRLSKKDATTRVKALKALITLFKERPASEVCQLLPNWIFEYKKLVQDDNQQVRESTHNAMSSIAVSVGRGLAPHVRMLMGAWWVSQFDPVREVSAAAQQSFQVAFQEPSKRLEALMFCATDVLMYIDSLLKLSPQTISEKSVPIEESTKKYELVISSALLALAAFLDIILQSRSSSSSLGVETAEDKGKLNTKKNLETKKEVEDSAARLCLNHKHFRDFFKSKSSQVRCASYQALRAFAQNVSAVFSEKDLDNIAGVVLGSFSEKDPACHAAMWDMVLYFSQKYPQAWNTNSTNKFVLPRLWSFLRHATYGSTKASYPCILPLLSLLPSQTMKLSTQFLKELFTSLWDGHNVSYMALEDEIVFLKTIQECFLWVINNADRFSAGIESSVVVSIQEFMIDSVLLEILWKSYTFTGFQVPSDCLPPDVIMSKGNSSVRETYEVLQKKERERYSDEFIENLRKCIIDVLSVLAEKSKTIVNFFWKRFPEVCYESVIFEARQSVGSISAGKIGCAHRISEFVLHFGKLLPSDETYKQFIINQAVRPLAAKLFSIVKATDFGDGIRLLAAIVSTFGPFCFDVFDDGKQRELSECKVSSVKEDNKDLEHIFSFIEKNLIFWCLDPTKCSVTEKVELLLSFFEDERFVGKWNSVLSYAIKFEDTESGPGQLNKGKLTVLAVLIENFRRKFLDLDTNESCKSQWDLSGLDEAAVTVAGSLSLADHSALHLLRQILSGFKNTAPCSLVAPETVERISRILLQRMLYILQKSEKEWANFFASCLLLPDIDPPLASLEDEKAISLACAAAKALCGSISSLRSINDSDATSKVVATFYCIQWAFGFQHFSRKRSAQPDFEGEGKESATIVYTDSGSSGEEDESPNHHDDFFMGNRFLAEDVQNMVKSISLVLNSGFCRNLSKAIRIQVQKMLIQCVRRAAFEGTSDARNMASACGNWVLALMDQLCTKAEDSQQFMDMLLEPTDAWPLFALKPSKGKRVLLLVEDQLELSPQNLRHARFVAFIDKVASLLGWEQLVVYQRSESSEGDQPTSKGKIIQLEEQCRIWLLIEMLCTWDWPGGNAKDTLLPFLVACTDVEERDFEQSIVSSVVVSLFMSAMSRKEVLEFNNKYWLGLVAHMEAGKDPCLRALLVLLNKICQGEKRVKYAEMFFKMLVIDQGFLEDTLLYDRSKVLPFILSILVPALHKQQENDRPLLSIIENLVPLKVVVCKWLEMALSSPPLSAHSDFVPDLEHALQNIIACFPLHSAGGYVAIRAAASANVSAKERALLVNLMQKETSDVTGFVAHVAKQYTTQRKSSLERKDARQLHEEILARLVAISIVYCWKEFTDQEWALVTHHMRKWLEAALLEAENFTQLVIDTKSVETKASKELLSSILDKISEEIQRTSNRSSDLSWTAVVLFSLVQALESSNFTGSSTSLKHLETINWTEGKHRVLSYIVRIFFASGMSESLALDSIAGEASANLIASSRVSNLEFWENVSEIVLNSSGEERIEIARHLNTWTVGKDPVRSLYALLFSSQPIGGLQHAAYNLLTSDPFQASAVIHGDMKDGLREESLNVGSTELPSSNVASLRSELAVVLETTPASILESPLASSVRVKYFLAWAIVLSHLRSISVSSAAGEKLVQYIQDSALSSTLLDSIFQHIPVSSEAGFSTRRRKSTSLWQAEIERVGDAARRACTLGSVASVIEGLWPREEDSVASLAAGLYGMLLQVLPACVRVWFTGLRDRSAASSVESFTTKFCSPQLLAEEFAQVHNSTVADDSLTIKANHSLGEVIVFYKKEEAGMDMVIKMPKCYPLRAVDIDCTRRLGISETRLRKWTLSMAAFLRNQNGAVAEAIQIWRQNVDREFEGVEECPICYSIIHTANHSLPRLACKTCKHKFHAACLYKWFSTSHKSTCPLCQTPF